MRLLEDVKSNAVVFDIEKGAARAADTRKKRLHQN